MFVTKPAAHHTAPMGLANEYKQQTGWRPWANIFDALPDLAGQTVLDLGCGVGSQSAEFTARGARVIGVDSNPELLREAQARGLAGAEFHLADLRALPDLGRDIDGLWCSFAAAYMPDLQPVLESWSRRLRPGAWVALTEIDDMFGHEPLSPRTKALFASYTRDALAAGRYDFHMGGKLRGHLERAGFRVSKVLTLEDRELAFDGPAQPPVLDAWHARLGRMTLLRDLCGADFHAVQQEFLSCLARNDHRSRARILCCIATR
jgi:SAM-dependent methyltransferase